MAREQKQVHVRRVTPRGDASRERVASEQQRQVEGAPVVRDEAAAARQLVLDGFEPRALPRRPREKQLDDAQAVFGAYSEAYEESVGPRAAREPRRFRVEKDGAFAAAPQFQRRAALLRRSQHVSAVGRAVAEAPLHAVDAARYPLALWQPRNVEFLRQYVLARCGPWLRRAACIFKSFGIEFTARTRHRARLPSALCL